MSKKVSDNIITIRDIAAMCGVSISTVSNVLNGKTHKVSKDVAEKIMNAVEKTGYKPNYLAKNLRASSTKTVGVIVEDLILFTVPPMVEGIMRYCERKGYTVIIENLRLFGRWSDAWMHDEALFQSALHPVLVKMDAMNVDGIIYVGGHEHIVNKLISTNKIPIVMTYATAGDRALPHVRLDDEDGGYTAIKYLMSKGHEKIGVIAGEPDNIHTINRIRGIQRAMFECGKLFDPSIVEYRQWNRKGGYEGMKALMNRDITAVFCMSDTIASGAYFALEEKHLIPGEDISIIGFDNQDISYYLYPQLTTVAQPLEEIGYEAVTKLINICESTEDTEDSKCDIRVKGKIIERLSVKDLSNG